MKPPGLSAPSSARIANPQTSPQVSRRLPVSLVKSRLRSRTAPLARLLTCARSVRCPLLQSRKARPRRRRRLSIRRSGFSSLHNPLGIFGNTMNPSGKRSNGVTRKWRRRGLRRRGRGSPMRTLAVSVADVAARPADGRVARTDRSDEPPQGCSRRAAENSRLGGSGGQARNRTENLASTSDGIRDGLTGKVNAETKPKLHPTTSFLRRVWR